jgi:hypothetical protein
MFRISNVARWTSSFTPPTYGSYGTSDISGGVARRIKKAYIGIGGVARPCLFGEGVEYYGTITALSAARYAIPATTVGNYALFGGGQTGTNAYSNVVDAYNQSLTRSTPTALSEAKYQHAATTVGNYALFGGGQNKAASRRKVVNAYDQSLTRSTPTALSEARNNLAATTVGNYALFGGGQTGSKAYSNVVDAYVYSS